MTASDVAGKCIVKKDDFKKTISITTCDYIKDDKTRHGPSSRYRVRYDVLLRLTADKKMMPYVLQCYVTETKEEWRFYRSAVRNDGANMVFHVILHDVFGGGLCQESFAVDLDTKDLPMYCEKGLLFRAYGKAGELTVEMPAFYFQGFVEVAKREGIKLE